MEKAWETSFDDILGETVTLNKKVPVRTNYTFNRKRGEKDIEDFDIKLLDKIAQLDTSEYKTFKLIDGYNTSQPIQSNGVTHTHLFYTKRNLIYLNKIFELIGDDSLLKAWFTSSLINTSKMWKYKPDRKEEI